MAMGYRVIKRGRLLEEFEVGAVYVHPWEVTIDAGVLALYAASFLDASPVFASAPYARALGFRDRPVAPLVLLNFGLSFSVHDVSEQAIAHLAYIDVRFPSPCYRGDTIRAASTVLDVKPSSDGGRGVVHVATVVRADDERVVCRFERKVLVKAGAGHAASNAAPPDALRVRQAESAPSDVIPSFLDRPLSALPAAPGFGGFFEDFAVGEVICHDGGRTVGESEHMQLTYLFRNTHPLHFEEPYASSQGFAKTRVVYGGLVFAWIASLASRDTSANVLWEMGFDRGAHPSGVVAGDTLYAASRVIMHRAQSAQCGEVTFKLVGTKNVKPSALLDAGADLFTDELAKAKRGIATGGAEAGKVKEKVFEIERTLRLRRRA